MINHNTATATFTIKPETAALTGQVEQMLDAVFGPARYDKASYLFRDGVAPLPELSYVAMQGDEVVGTIRYWPILVGPTNHPALLLGPLGITPRLAGKGIGRTLTFRTLERAAEIGHDLVLLVGDVDYYKRFGFVPATPHGFVMPGEARPERLQVAPLAREVLGRISGDIHHIHTPMAAQALVLDAGLPVGDRSGSLNEPAAQAGAR
nr:N-acetyltransferase [uncultured Dongia sp.]